MGELIVYDFWRVDGQELYKHSANAQPEEYG